MLFKGRSRKNAPTPRETNATLNADIIHLIIDLLAHEADSPATRVQSIRACSKVSRVFNEHARKHLFSSIRFQFSNNIKNRDRRLFQFLKDPRNRNLHPYIRSVKIILGPVTPSSRDNMPSMSMPDIVSVYKASLRSAGRKFLPRSSVTDIAFISNVLDFLQDLPSLNSLALTPIRPTSIRGQIWFEHYRRLTGFSSSLPNRRSDSTTSDYSGIYRKHFFLVSQTHQESPIFPSITPISIGLKLFHPIRSWILQMKKPKRSKSV